MPVIRESNRRILELVTPLQKQWHQVFGLEADQKPSRRSLASALIIGATSTFYLWFIPAQGQLHPSELVLAIVLIVLSLGGRKPKLGNLIGVAMAFWLIGTVVSDAVTRNDLVDASKGILRIVFLWLDLAALDLLVVNKWSRALLLWAGIGVAAFISFVFYPNIYAYSDVWKFGLASGVTVVAILILSFKVVPQGARIGGFAALGVLHFVLGSRSLAIICVVVVLLLLLRVKPVLQGDRVRIWPRLVIASVIAVVIGTISIFVYDNAARSGILGEDALVKASYQASGPLGSILSGRTEVLLSLQTIRDHPLFGVGSFSTSDANVVATTAQIFRNWGYQNVANYLATHETPFHSELLGSVAENGVLAAPFWILVLALMVAGIRLVLLRRARFPELLAFVSVLGIWDVFFSPFGGERRFWLAGTLLIIIMSIRESRTWTVRSSASKHTD